MSDWWTAPEGVRVLPDGGWTVGGYDIVHLPSLRYLKARLVFEEEGAWLVDGPRRLPVSVDGPAFEVIALRLDADKGEAWATLDDGTEEEVTADELSLDERTSRVECLVRDGRARALLSRGAHQVLLGHIEKEGDRFFLRVGRQRIPVRT